MAHKLLPRQPKYGVWVMSESTVHRTWPRRISPLTPATRIAIKCRPLRISTVQQIFQERTLIIPITSLKEFTLEGERSINLPSPIFFQIPSWYSEVQYLLWDDAWLLTISLAECAVLALRSSGYNTQQLARCYSWSC